MSCEVFLHAAAAAGDAEEVAQLLAAGASVNERNALGDTPLATAALAGHLAVVQQLLMAGADVTAAGRSGETALHRAAQHGHVSVLQLMLSTATTGSVSDQAGASCEAAVNAGTGSTAGTALHAAVVFRQTTTAEVLLAAGADTDATNRSGLTPLQFAALQKTTNNGCLSLLLSAGADVNTASAAGLTALELACQKSNAAAVKLLLAAGANPNTRHNAMAVRRVVQLGGSPVSLDTLYCLLQHFGNSPADIATLVEWAAMAAQERSTSPDMARLAVRKLLLAAAQRDAPVTQAALQQHFPEHRDAAALVAGVLLDMVLEAAAADAGAQNTAMQKLLVDAALLQKEQQPVQNEDEQQVVQVLEELTLTGNAIAV